MPRLDGFIFVLIDTLEDYMNEADDDLVKEDKKSIRKFPQLMYVLQVKHWLESGWQGQNEGQAS